ncbi:hypothetical protein [Bradyrhizobium sp. Leo121]|uniref:hypothetical protein n=1 Tax=Bradyrhizobium sp. Leo121 TaxID=1571195 RepID=UPI00102A640C|nr:hypothetical protein [Bradyrhizobium sp. Leo121]
MTSRKRVIKRVLFAIWNTVALIALSLDAGYLILLAFAGSGPVWVASNLRVGSTRVPVHGSITYTIDIEARESCPGQVVQVMVLLDSDPPATVTFRRPVVLPGVSRDDVAVSIQLPDAVHPGRWRFTASIESNCATRQQLDDLAAFDVEVY